MHKSIIFTTLVAILALGCLHVSSSEHVNKSAEFIATDEWQVVSEGQAIPKGLHVRINLQTGVKEAKLLDPNERDTALQSQSDEKSPGTANEPQLSLEHKADMIEESVRKVKEHRSYAELRKAYKDF